MPSNSKSSLLYLQQSSDMARIPINLKTGEAEDKPSELIIGIDLGTTNSIAAYTVDNVPIAIKDMNDDYTLVPSVIYFAPNGDIQVGNEAMAKMKVDPENTIYSIKRLMGKAFKDIADFEKYFSYKVIDEDEDKLVKIQIRDKFYSPIELSAQILKQLKQNVESQLDTVVNRAVITVPAYFNDAQRQATRDAGKLAGLDVLRIVNEPTAAALAYGLEAKENALIAVYDLGGGTFDISILHIQDGVFEVLSTNGDTFLGGDDFDRAIQDHWIASHNLASWAEDKTAMQELRLAAESAKKALSNEDKFSTRISKDDKAINLEIDREKFASLTKSLVDKTLVACQQALDDSKKGIADIDQIIMVGGSTRMPIVKKAVADFFAKPINDSLNPDEVVAMGAAVQADILSGKQDGMLLLDITPLSLGIETVGGLMDPIIQRNAKVPIRAGRSYTTSVDGQANLKVAVYQGERDLVTHNRKLGEFILKGIPPMPAGIPKIEIHFIVNADGILKVKAKETRSDVKTEVVIKSQYGVSEEEMARMLLDSIQNAESDMKIKVLLEARNEAANILLGIDRFKTQNEGVLSSEQSTTLDQLRQKLDDAKNGEDKDKINLVIQEVNSFTAPLAHLAIDKAIQDAMKGKKV